MENFLPAKNGRFKFSQNSSGCSGRYQGPMLRFLKYFRRKMCAKILGFFAHSTASFNYTVIIQVYVIILVFEKSGKFSPIIGTNCRKIVITT
jgi:hypothetical protein